MTRRRDRHHSYSDGDDESVTPIRREPRLLPTDVDPGEMGEVLAALEGLAAEHAAIVMRQRGLAPLEAALDQMKQAAAWGDDWDLTAAHIEFHKVFVQLCGNRVIAAAWSGAEPLLRRHGALTRGGAGPSAIDEHLDLVNLARRSPLETFRREIEEHARRHFPPVTRRQPQRYDERSFQEDDDDDY
jgi:DNA-binding GntR family transcriptional regulator